MAKQISRESCRDEAPARPRNFSSKWKWRNGDKASRCLVHQWMNGPQVRSTSRSSSGRYTGGRPPALLDTSETPYGLYRKLKEAEGGEWHHWIYASPTSSFSDPLYDDWDTAFNDLLQHHAATPAAHNASFHVITCGLSWLCDMWRIKGPALIHMTNAKPMVLRLQ